MRKSSGAELAREAPAAADVVVPVPDFGVPAAIGYAQEFGIPYELGIIRNHYVGRTFIEPTQHIRQLGVRLKHSANRAVVSGKRIVLIDDLIVRGTTSVKIVQMMREAGAREVHFRIAPGLLSARIDVQGRDCGQPALDSGKYTPNSIINGKSPITVSGVPLQNDNNDNYGPVTLTKALTDSINTVWAQVGLALGRHTMQTYMHRFGFYSVPPLDYPPGRDEQLRRHRQGSPHYSRIRCLGADGLRSRRVRTRPRLRQASQAVRRADRRFPTGAGSIGPDARRRHDLDELCHRLSQLEDQGKGSEEAASLAKAYCTVSARQTVGLARELLGGNGILLEEQVGRSSPMPRPSTHRGHARDQYSDRGSRPDRGRRVRLSREFAASSGDAQ